ncbi:MAG: CBS domain-containing protein [Patescibacteria group bacterium]|jgi:CBS domain-containing protein|nr:CBS domain-containing protein [Patescibacteria group bacterium]MDD5173151.1 CBS domain-containing protein [Patescibacteria group bacterium]
MKVKDIMQKKVISLRPDNTYEEAVKILYNNDITGAPVIDEEENLVGYVSEKDLFNILYPYYKSYYEHPEIYTDFEKREDKAQEIKYQPVERFMNKSPLTIEPEMFVMSAGAIMLAQRIHQFLVVEKRKVVGIISREMIYRTIFKKNFNL